MNTLFREHDRKREKAFICWTEGEKDNEEYPATVTAKSPKGDYFRWIYSSEIHGWIADFKEEDAPSELHGLGIADEIRDMLSTDDSYGTLLYIDEDGEITDVSIY